MPFLQKEKSSSPISTYNTSDSAISTSRSFEKCRRRTSFSDCRNLVADQMPSLWSLPVEEATPTSNPCELNRSRNKLDLIQSDVWGPTHNVSIGGSHYFVTFINDYTRHTWPCLIEKKSKVFSCFLKVKNLAKWEMGRKIKCLRSDGGKEYFFDQFSSYLQKEEILIS